MYFNNKNLIQGRISYLEKEQNMTPPSLYISIPSIILLCGAPIVCWICKGEKAWLWIGMLIVGEILAIPSLTFVFSYFAR